MSPCVLRVKSEIDFVFPLVKIPDLQATLSASLNLLRSSGSATCLTAVFFWTATAWKYSPHLASPSTSSTTSVRISEPNTEYLDQKPPLWKRNNSWKVNTPPSQPLWHHPQWFILKYKAHLLGTSPTPVHRRPEIACFFFDCTTLLLIVIITVITTKLFLSVWVQVSSNLTLCWQIVFILMRNTVWFQIFI